jgi:ammonium transporter, Amt family
MFAAFTPALVLGAAAERGRILPILVFVFVWATLVYDPIASWTWNSAGWAAKMGVLDFAGGTPVHITSGASALAYSLVLGPRKVKVLQVLSSLSRSPVPPFPLFPFSSSVFSISLL